MRLKKRLGQVSFEYLMISGLFMVVLLPTVYIFFAYASESADEIDGAQLNAFATETLTTAESLYYLGSPSRLVVEQRFPNNVVGLRVSNDPGGDTFFLEADVVDSKGVSTVVFPTDVNISGSFSRFEIGGGIKQLQVEAAKADDGDTVVYLSFAKPARVFVTSGVYRGSGLGGVNGADASCQDAADVAVLGGSWRAWLSDGNNDARDRFFSRKFIRLDDVLVANSMDDLTDGELRNPINVDQNGNAVGSGRVWTGTLKDGTVAGTSGEANVFRCNDWLSGGNGKYGDLTKTDAEWTDQGQVGCGQLYRLYCVEQEDISSFYGIYPSILSISPDHGPETVTTSVTITGENFDVEGSVAVYFGNEQATVVTASENVLDVTAPASVTGPGPVNVIVRNSDGRFDVKVNGFSYEPPPIITGVLPSPFEGPTSGGTPITINGNNFVDGAVVEVDGIVANNLNFVNDKKITADTPAHPPLDTGASVGVLVRNPDGQADTWSPFTYVPPPEVTGIIPVWGSTNGGEVATISGNKFRGNPSTITVSIGGGAATVTNVPDSNTIEITTPVHAAGTFDVVVTNDDGQSDTLIGGYTFNLPPGVDNVDIVSGPTGGGTLVTITGNDFIAPVTVTFDGLLATVVPPVTSTQIKVNTPAHPPLNVLKIVDIVVTSADLQAILISNAFTYVPPPDVTGLSQGDGSTLGGSTVTVNGENFVAPVVVEFGGTAGTNPVVADDGKSITVTTPAHGAGVVGVRVVNPDGQEDVLPGSFEFIPPPTITTVSPDKGPVSGGRSILIGGTNFRNLPSVSFGGTPAASVVFDSVSQLTVVTPAHAKGLVDVVVTNPDSDAQSATKTNAYEFLLPPTITGVAPSSGYESGGESVTITGTDFTPSLTVTFGGVGASIVSSNSTQITVITPVHAPGFVDVVVTNVDGQLYTEVNGFEYLALCNDADGDGYGVPASPFCPGGSTLDCDDTPGSGNNIHQNKNVGKDADQDGYYTGAAGTQCVGSSTTISGRTYYEDASAVFTWLDSGSAIGGGDCQDGNPAINPGAAELCNGIDDNCVNGIDEGLPTATYYWDDDLDGYGNPTTPPPQIACSNPGAQWVTTGGDCDDTTASLWQYLTGYPDDDNDGYPSSGTSQQVCSGSSLPSGWSSSNPGIDCLNGDNSKWQNLNGYQDTDLDTYTTGGVQSVCSGSSLPSGWRSLPKGDDCNDGNINVWRMRYRDGTACNAEYKCVGNDAGFQDTKPMFKVFVSDRVSDSRLGWNTGANAICAGIASGAGLSGSWNAWISGGAFSGPADQPEPSLRTCFLSGPNSVGWEMVGGGKIADNWADLTDGTLDTSIRNDENGVNRGGTWTVWTGTHSDGSPYPNTLNCNGFGTSGGANGIVGYSGAANTLWTEWQSRTCDTNGVHLYCFQYSKVTPVHRVFVTSTTYNGNLGGLSGGDSKCQARADAANGGAGLGGTWVAWLSDSNTDAKNRVADQKYHLVDGVTLVANNLADLTDGSLQNKILKDENGNTISVPPYAWTGTNSDGTRTSTGNTCADWTISFFGWKGITGFPSWSTGGVWTNAGDTGSDCSGAQRLYCFETT